MSNFRRIRRRYFAICTACWGCGKDFGSRLCSVCNGTGEVERFLVEWVHSDEKETNNA